MAVWNAYVDAHGLYASDANDALHAMRPPPTKTSRSIQSSSFACKAAAHANWDALRASHTKSREIRAIFQPNDMSCPVDCALHRWLVRSASTMHKEFDHRRIRHNFDRTVDEIRAQLIRVLSIYSDW